MKPGWKTATAAGALTLAAVFALGPRARVEEDPIGEPDVPAEGLDRWLAESEAAVPGIRPGDEKGIVWYGAPDSVTDVAVVYLHGFSADRHELDPVPEEVARALGANVFFTRLTGHGRDGPAMADAAAGDWLRDAREAVAVGRRLGRKVVLIGTSTGGTLAAWAAERYPDLMAAVLVSPNFAVRDDRARMLLWPWGGAIARLVAGSERCFKAANQEQARHWTTCYPTRVLLPMMALVEHVRVADPARLRVPVLVLYSPDDQVVNPDETRRLFAGFGSEDKRMVEVEGSPVGEHHVLAGDILSPGTNATVEKLILDFLSPLAAEVADPPVP